MSKLEQLKEDRRILVDFCGVSVDNFLVKGIDTKIKEEQENDEVYSQKCK